MGEAARADNVVPINAKRARERNPVWDACVEVLGYEPATDSEKKLWGRMTTSLRNAGATDERIRAVAKWYRKHWPTVDLTITALEKWYSHFLRMEEDRNKTRAAVCPDCGIGGGRHVAGCKRSKA